MKTRSLAAAGAALFALSVAAHAQTPQTTPPPAKRPGLLSRLLHHGQKATPPDRMMTPGQTGAMMGRPPMGHAYGRRPMMGGMTNPMMGGIIGNKNTHVYHMPGEGGSLPAPQNRVYFRSVAQAQAAGYHAAGQGHASGGRAGTGLHMRPMHPMPMGASH